MSAKTVLPGLALSLALGLATGGHTATVSEAPTPAVKIHISDVNPDTQAGAAVVLRRIRNAARTVCGPEPIPTDLNRYEQYSDCTRSTVDRTVASLGNPMVAALNDGRVQASSLVASRR